MSENYLEIVKNRYPRIYSLEDVKLFVKAKKLTKEEFKEITGEDYKE